VSIGASGRIVIEVEPDLKQELHAALREEGTNLKAWFLENAQAFLSNKSQMPLDFDDQSPARERLDEVS
jgi:hypothetical protein